MCFPFERTGFFSDGHVSAVDPSTIIRFWLYAGSPDSWCVWGEDWREVEQQKRGCAVTSTLKLVNQSSVRQPLSKKKKKKNQRK